MNDQNVDGTKVMDVVFTVSGGIYGAVKDKVSGLYSSGVLQGGLPKGAVITGVFFDVANDLIKLSVAITSGEPREVAKVVVGAIGGATGTYVGGSIGANFAPAKYKILGTLAGMGVGSIFGDSASELIFDTYVWPSDSQTPRLVSGGGVSLNVSLSLEPKSPSLINTTPAPSGLDTPARNSAALINTTGAHTTQFNSGGGVDDLWVVEKNAGRYLGTRDQFRADFVASNANVDGKTLGVQQGQNYYVPQRSANGNTVYHYSNGATVMNNAITGEYHMVVPNTDGSGGQTVYSRTADDVGYTVKQVSTNAAGAVVFEHQSYQNTLDTDLNPVSTTSVSGNQTTTRNWLTDNVYQTDTFVGPPAPTNTTPSTSSLDFGPVSYNLFDAAQNNDASYKMWQLNQNNGLSSNAYNSFTQQSSNFVVDYSLGGTGSSNWGQLKPPSNFDFFPIGAFYDSQSAAFDNAASIANKTTRAMNASGQALTANQLAALDTNNDGQISTAEAAGMRLWADLNENGTLDANELQSVGSTIQSADYGFYTRGNGQAAGARLTPACSLSSPVHPFRAISIQPVSKSRLVKSVAMRGF